MTTLLSLDDAIIRLDRAATMKDDGRHEHYDRTVQLANEYSALATGHMFDQFLTIFNRRENSTEFDQRKLLTIPRTPALLAPTIAQFARTSRLQNIRREISYRNNVKNSVVDRTKQAITDFYGKGGVEEYIATIYDWVSLIDPNAFTVVEFERNETGQIQPYPFIAWAYMVYEYGRTERNQINYLMTEPSAGQYILYAGEFAMKYSVLPDIDKGRASFIAGASNVYIDAPIFQPVDATGKAIGPAYLRQFYETNVPFVQAEVMGYLPDPVTGFKTYVSALEPAKYVLIDLQRTGSNYDLSKYLHVFPQKVVFAEKCNDTSCTDGRYSDNSVCPTCKGSGERPTLTQPTDILKVPKPTSDRDPLPDLSKYIYYVQQDLSTLNALGLDIDKLANSVQIAVFNNELVKRQTAVASTPTATDILIKRDDINNTLMPFAEHKAQHYIFLGRCSAVMVNDTQFKIDDLAVIYEFPKDLKPITADEIYVSLKAAIDANAPSMHIEQIVKDLLEMAYEGDPAGLKRLQVQLSHIPFIGLSWVMIQYLDAKGYLRKRDMVLLAYRDSVFADLERVTTNFYDMQYSERDKLITDYIGEIIKALPDEQPVKLNMGKVNPLPVEEPVAA